MWGLGKISQRFGEYEDALTWFKKAAEIEWQNPDVAREASICALRLGRGGDALLFAEEAAKLRPQDWGLYANWALALLVNGRTRRAREVAAHAVEGAPQDPVSRRVLALIVNLEASDGPVPKNLDEIEQLIARSG
jgi:Flp pilus assembly protein TadD